jgi:hypothetical protein
LTGSPPWGRIFRIGAWLCLFPPWGLWLLYKDPVLTKSTKKRVLFYSLAVPVMLFCLLFIMQMRQADQMLATLGG